MYNLNFENDKFNRGAIYRKTNHPKGFPTFVHRWICFVYRNTWGYWKTKVVPTWLSYTFGIISW